MSFLAWAFEGSYLFQHIATIFQILKMIKRNNSECVSLETNILFLIGSLSRLCWIFNSVLSSFFLTYIELFLAFSSLIYVIYLYEKNKVRNYYINVVKLPEYLKLYVLLPLITILSIFFHPGKKILSDQIFVSLGIFAEAVGLFPQLYIIRKSKDSGDLSKLYIVFLGIARFIRLFFWIKMIMTGKNYYSIIFADLVHTLALSNFIYNAIKNWSGKGLPTSFSELQSNSNKKMF